jgi:hypothetical protein
MVFARRFLGLGDQSLRVRNRLGISTRPRQLGDAPHERRKLAASPQKKARDNRRGQVSP